MSVAIEFSHVSKTFHLHMQRSRTIQETLVNLFQKRKDKARSILKVLDDVSFTVEKGEAVGLIGPNGTGKSTTLKLINRILMPDSGTMMIDGRVGALLELGAGFHPDLTGIENIFLNAAILGISKNDIRQKLESIIEFSELGQFIDIPVKHYSSGMYTRLGFSIAVHVEPEILLVDEVLAVGDATFQRKCMDRIDELRRNHTTILLVSHDVNSVQRVCNRAIWMEGGKILADGNTEEVAQKYLWHSLSAGPDKRTQDGESRWGSGEIKINSVRLLDQNNQEQKTFYSGQPFTVELNYEPHQRVEETVFGIAIHRSDGVHVTGPNTQHMGLQLPPLTKAGKITYTVSRMPLLEGTYYLSVAVHNRNDTKMYDYHHQLYQFRVMPGKSERYGLISLGGVWNIQPGEQV